LSHGGEVSGYTAENMVFPDERVAVVVLTNQDAVDASGAIARGIAPLLLASDDPATPEKLAEVRGIFAGLQHGTVDRSLFTGNANFYFNGQALKDFSSSLGPLGEPLEFIQVRQGLRGGMKLRVYSVKFPKTAVRIWTYEMPDGKLEQYQLAVQD
jgi:D-alanyl-D-alanine carboxypeptidase